MLDGQGLHGRVQEHLSCPLSVPETGNFWSVDGQLAERGQWSVAEPPNQISEVQIRLSPASFLCEQQLEGDLETLALVTYSTLCLSMLALILTVLVLSCLRGLKSNTRSIHSNTAAAMFLSELVFLLGINQTEQQVNVPSCTTVYDYY